MAQFECNFHSYSLGYPVNICVTVPSVSSCDPNPTHTVTAPFPVIYLLHGHGNDYKCWLRYTSAERYAEEHRIALVTCSVDNKKYENVESTGERFYDFVADELPSFVQNYFPISNKPEETYICGYSMGGYGTAIHAFTHPERFAAAGLFSPAVGVKKSRPDLAVAYDTDELVRQFAGKPEQLPKIFLCVGKDDFLYPAVTEYHALLEECGIPHRYDALDGYAHEFSIWDLELEEFMNWIPRSDPYAAQVPYKI